MNNFKYIKFKDNNKRLSVTTIRKIVEFLAKLIFPKANQNIDNIFYWLIEIDNETGIPEREIGLDKNYNPIFGAPLNDNLGFWLDSDLVGSDYNRFIPIEITKYKFEKYRKIITSKS